MADTKITDLAELAAAPAAGDELVLVDDSDTTMAASGTNKRISFANLLKAPTLGVSAADTLTVNSGAWTLGSNYTATRAAGALATGTTILQTNNSTFSGDAGGASFGIGQFHTSTASGANALTGATSFYPRLTVSTSAGATTTARVVNAEMILSGAGTATNAIGFTSNLSLTSTGGMTSAWGFLASTPTLSSTGAVTNLTGFYAQNLGHATLVTNALGFDQGDFTTPVTLAVGFRSLMSSGTGKWGFQHNGTANNAFLGNTRIGSVVAPTKTLDVTGDLGVSGDTTLGDAAGDTLTVNAGIHTIGSDYVATRAAGAQPSGVTNLQQHEVTLSGHAGGTTNARGWGTNTTVTGANSLTAAVGIRAGVQTDTTAGTVTALYGTEGNAVVNGAGAVTNASGVVASVLSVSTGNIADANVVTAASNLFGAGNITNSRAFYAPPPLFTSTGAITNNVGFTAANLGHATLVTNSAIGFECADFTLGAASSAAAFRSNMASGTNKWAFYGIGTANSAFGGNVRVGGLTTPTETLHVTGTLATSGIAAIGTTTSATTTLNLPLGATGVSPLRIAHGVAPTAPVNGDLWTSTAGLFSQINGVTRGPYPYKLAAAGSNIPDKGNLTSEETFVTVVIPANSMGINGSIRVTSAWTCTSSANDKTVRVRLGGTELHATVNPTSGVITMYPQTLIQNRGVTNSQVGSAGYGTGAATTAIPTAAIQTGSDANLTITGQKETGTETLTLQRYLVEVIPSV